MKKKSPPYAIIGAVVLGILGIVIFMKYQAMQAADAQARIDAATAQMKKDLEAANSKPTANLTETPTDVRPVLYATQPVEAGIRISPAFYEKKNTPKDIMPDAYTDTSDIVGWYAIRKIEKGDPLTPRNIGKSLPYMSQRITPGMRAVAIKVFDVNSDANNTGGFAVDGDNVDLLYSTSLPEGTHYKVNTQTVMQNVRILYVPGPPIKTEKTDGITPIGVQIITFEVTPEQAQALIFMSNASNAQFHMVLRSRKDNTEIKIKPFDVRDYDLLNLKKVQKTVDKSEDRVKALAQEIEDKEKAQASQGTTNETTTPTPPTP